MALKADQELKGSYYPVISAFSRALGRETHVLTQYPELLWQQMYNRLQWEGIEVDEVLGPELTLRIEPGTTPWMRLITPQRESSSLVRTLPSHTDSVNGCVFSLDGRLLVSASSDKTLRVWDITTGQTLRTLEGHTDSVNACALSPDGRWIVSAANDKTLRIWDAATGQLLRTFEGHTGSVNACAFSPDGRWIVSASNMSYIFSTGGEKTICIWDFSTGSLLCSLKGHSRDVLSCTFSPDGGSIASSSQDRSVRVWDVLTRETLITINPPSRLSEEEIFLQSVSDDPDLSYDAVQSCAFSPDALVIAAGGKGMVACIFDAVTGTLIHELHGHKDTITSCTFSPGRNTLASSSRDRTIHLWDTASGQLLGVIEAHAGAVQACAFSPSGQLLATAGADNVIRLWDVTSAQHGYSHLSGHPGGVTDCEFSPDGIIFASVGRDNNLQIWNTSTGKPFHTLEGGKSDLSDSRYNMLTVSDYERYTDEIHSCSFSPDGKSILSGGTDTSIRLWDPLDGQMIDAMNSDDTDVTGCRFSPDGRWIISWQKHFPESAGYIYNRLWVWSTQTRQVFHTLNQEFQVLVASPDISPDSRLIVSIDGSKLRIWGITTGKEFRVLECPSPGIFNACKFSPNGGLIASASRDGKVRIWDSTTGFLLKTLDGLSCCVFSPDGGLIAAGGDEGAVRVWETDRGLLLHTLYGHTDIVNALAFSPDGYWIVSTSQDRTLRVWETSSGNQVGQLHLTGSPVSLDMHPTEPRVLCGDDTGSIYLVKVIGIEFSSIIVTATLDEHGLKLVCPGCQTQYQITEYHLGKDVSCASERCQLRLKLNPFVIRQ